MNTFAIRARAAKKLAAWEFDYAENFLGMFEKGYQPLEDSLRSQAIEAGSDADEYLESLADEFHQLGSAKRLGHVAILLRSASIVEVAVRSVHANILGCVKRQGTVSEKRLKRWEKDFRNRGGLEQIVEEISLFTNSSGFSVDARTLTGWPDVNDARRLCNCFKHRGGVIRYGGDIDLSVDEKRVLQIVGARTVGPDAISIYHVPYEDLNVRGYLASAHGFCDAIFDATKQLLDGSEVRP